MEDYDVVVCGGGPAGIGAAFSAANMGLKTAIIERHFMLGGNWTNGYVLSVLGMYTYDGENKIVGGIADEVVAELKKNGGTEGQAGNFVPFRPDEMKLTLDTLAKKKGITVYYGSLVKSTKKDGNRISSVYVSGKSNTEVKGKFFIDSTGDADIAFYSGAKIMSGMENSGIHQQATLPFRIGNINEERIILFAIEHQNFISVKVNEKGRLERFRVLPDFVKLAKEKYWLYLPYANAEFMFNTSKKGEFVCNATHVNIDDFTDGNQMAKAIEDAREQIISSIEFFTKEVSGFEDAYLIDSAPSIGLRETRRAVGEYVLKMDDVLNNARFEDAIARCGHPIEVHDPNKGVIYTHLKGGDGSFYDVPYRSIVVKGIDNLFAIGRCLSAEFYAQASARVTGTAMAMGQAAASAAKIAIDKELKAKDVPIKELQELLKKNGAIL
ncbi:FAD-dependent oxidoreductase [Candidatus Marsarchaeota archaeon]|nr:FAD-dependent oxidoreductase [Candidatus Marsarchaeota archaeon]MCL5405025.1 FAD-dependent oxidoreductase [Candidatus Marsarchaeota archaeon]